MINNSEEKVLKVLRRKVNGVTITELASFSKLSRSTIRVVLARMEGSNRVDMRNLGMAKLFKLKEIEVEENVSNYFN